jgi:hypothetical protein
MKEYRKTQENQQPSKLNELTEVNSKQSKQEVSLLAHSDTDTYSDTNTVINTSVEPTGSPLIAFPLNDKSEYEIYETLKWEELYPAVDIMQELRNMKGWLMANPKKAKTRSGILRFINSWLSKAQDRGGNEKAKRNGQHLTPVQRVQKAFAERRGSGESLDGGGADLRGQVDYEAR